MKQICLTVGASGGSGDDSAQLPPKSPSKQMLRRQLLGPIHKIASSLTFQLTNPNNLLPERGPCLSLSLWPSREAHPDADTLWGILSKPMCYFWRKAKGLPFTLICPGCLYRSVLWFSSGRPWALLSGLLVSSTEEKAVQQCLCFPC